MINLTWQHVASRAMDLAKEIKHLPGGLDILLIYGVPRGGIYAAQLISNALTQLGRLNTLVEDPKKAHVLIDDIIDTGKTRRTWNENDNGWPFFALVDKQGKDKNLKDWISFPWERMINDDGPVENIRRILEYIGEDPERDGLKNTPERVIKSYEKLFGGYKQKPEDVITAFEQSCDEMVLLKSIEFYSFCEHHMLPFYGKAHIAYIPNGKVIGISKLARILEIYSRRLQIQERLCQQVTQAIEKVLKPLGAACVLEARHHCMICRGVEKQNSIMVTSSLTGVFKTDISTRAEFINMIGK